MSEYLKKEFLTLQQESLDEGRNLSSRWVERIFTRLGAQLGAKIADLYAGCNPDDVKSEWGKALWGFLPEEISRGLDACQKRVFAPTLGEFLRLCRPCLDSEYAWIEAVHGMRDRESGKLGDWSHPAVYRAASKLTFELRCKTYKDARKLWESTLERELSQGWGMCPPDPPKMLNHQHNFVPPSDEFKKKLAELKDGWSNLSKRGKNESLCSVT